MTRTALKHISRPEGAALLKPLELNNTRVGVSHTVLTPTLLSADTTHTKKDRQ